MKARTEKDKLRVLLPHWIEHNAGHAAEFREWAEKAGEVKQNILNAAAQMESANRALEEALEQMGGALEGEQHHHH
jgi:rubrerythrin